MGKKTRPRPVLGNTLRLNADESEMMRKFHKEEDWPDDVIDEQPTDEEYRALYFDQCVDQDALSSALGMLPVSSGSREELTALGEIIGALASLHDRRSDPSAKQLATELEKIQSASASLSKHIERFQAHNIRDIALLGEPLKTLVYYNPKYLKALEDNARQAAALLPKSAGGRQQGLRSILTGSPKQRFAEDLAYLWLRSGLELTASVEGSFATFLRLVH